MERACLTLAMGVSGHVSRTTGKDKRDAKGSISLEAGEDGCKRCAECELRSESERV